MLQTKVKRKLKLHSLQQLLLFLLRRIPEHQDQQDQQGILLIQVDLER